MKNIKENVAKFVKGNKKKIVAGTVIVAGVVTGVLVVKYMGNNSTETVADTVEVLIEGTEEAIDGIDNIQITTV